ncbi:HET-domain-containing protein [Whalleya microplaca]|nr:HET-domain-containing protein [Whalleya microplaca]
MASMRISHPDPQPENTDLDFISTLHRRRRNVSHEIKLEEIVSGQHNTEDTTTCHACGLILQALEWHKPGWIMANSLKDCSYTIRIDEYGQMNLQRVTLHELVPLDPPSPINSQVAVCSFDIIQRPSSIASDETMWSDMCRSWNVIEDSSTQAAFDRAAQWLSHCIENDKSCEPPNKNFVPRRLLDVGYENEKGEPFLFAPTEPTAYACLSYCWGPNVEDVLKTTTSNLNNHYNEITLGSMPKSIQDAVRVCKGLRIPYLWVDSLCIVQDDHDEWLKDACMMDHIYLNSHVTITALEPDSCKTGFLGKQRFGLPEWQYQLKIHGSSQEVVIRPQVDQTVECSLDKRGWCLQEMLLPYRRLCFDGNEMSWECSCRKLCECGHFVWPNNKSDTDTDKLSLGMTGVLLKEKALASAPAPKPTIPLAMRKGRYLEWLLGVVESPCGRHSDWQERRGPGRVYELWRKLVSSYSRRSLSRQSDKLTALAGLANVLRDYNQNENEYLDGLWKVELPFELAWRVIALKVRPEVPDDEDSGTISQEDCFPSWSWACSDEVISYDFSYPLWQWNQAPKAIDQCLVRGIDGISGEETPSFKGSRIRLEGKLVPVELAIFKEYIPLNGLEGPFGSANPDLFRPWTLQDHSDEITAFVRSQNLRAVRVYLDKPAGPEMRQDDARASCWIKGKCEEKCCSWNQGQDHAKSRYYCFRLFSWKSPNPRQYLRDGSQAPSMGPETWFLVLKSSCRVGQAFERIGVSVWNEWRGSKSCHLFELAETAIIDII